MEKLPGKELLAQMVYSVDAYGSCGVKVGSDYVKMLLAGDSITLDWSRHLACGMYKRNNVFFLFIHKVQATTSKQKCLLSSWTSRPSAPSTLLLPHPPHRLGRLAPCKAMAPPRPMGAIGLPLAASGQPPEENGPNIINKSESLMHIKSCELLHSDYKKCR